MSPDSILPRLKSRVSRHPHSPAVLSQADLLPVVEQRLERFNIPFVKAQVQEGGVQVTQVRAFVQASFHMCLLTFGLEGRSVRPWCKLYSVYVCSSYALWGVGVVCWHGVCRQVSSRGMCCQGATFPLVSPAGEV